MNDPSLVASEVQFDLHPNLLYSVILRQAGSLDKAVTEGVMNAIEADATAIHITAEDDVISISDNGRGFTSLDEINRVFKVFGQPHTEEEMQRKTYAQFRIGRGQMFAFGRNIWRTGPFEMDVNIKERGSVFRQKTNLDPVTGCVITIHLYERILFGYASMTQFRDTVQQQIEFVKVPVYFNGELLSRDPAKCKWDAVDENAYYSFGVGSGLNIYNLGIFVRARSFYDVGVNGIVVSRKQLKVNFARNDVMLDCPVYKQISEVVKKKRASGRTKKKKLTDAERIATLKEVRTGAISIFSVDSMRLFPDVNGRFVSFLQVRCEKVWTAASTDSDTADFLQRTGTALVLDSAWLFNLGYRGDLGEFFKWLTPANDRNDEIDAELVDRVTKAYVSIERLSKKIDVKYLLIPQADWRPSEHLIVGAITEIAHRLRGVKAQRSIVVGDTAENDTTLAWTDGETYIAFARSFLESIRDSAGIFRSYRLLDVLLHEYAHDDSTMHTHHHGPDFFQRMEELRRDNFYMIDALHGRLLDRARQAKADRRARGLQKKEKARLKKLGLLSAPTA